MHGAQSSPNLKTERGRFNKSLLPPAQTFYTSELGELRRSSRSWYRPLAGCPFHPSKSKKSFLVDISTGRYVCWGCNVRGDIVDFVRRRYNLNFIDACRRLNCLEADGKPIPTQKKSGRLVRYLVFVYSIAGQEHRSEIIDESRNEKEQLRRLYAEAIEQLMDMQGAPEKEAVQWDVMAASWDLMHMEERFIISSHCPKHKTWNCSCPQRIDTNLLRQVEAIIGKR